MKTIQDIIASILLITAITLAILLWPQSEVSMRNSHHVFTMEQSSPTTETLNLYWPSYFGVVKVPLYTWYNDVSAPESEVHTFKMVSK